MTSYDSMIKALEEKQTAADKRLKKATSDREKCENVAGNASKLERAKRKEDACYDEWLDYTTKIASLVQQRDKYK